ncbi:hypothetical protein CEV33_3601 [Brucella grignonensis]|uniref:Uncharacterized protein n=1 Tax=Brucella grignonensis TaxID=94627 RepID=A0A256EZG8_9HYPH|nr:hypothetical protein CEV33_3601 [Brucella grignonensis]
MRFSAADRQRSDAADNTVARRAGAMFPASFNWRGLAA